MSTYLNLGRDVQGYNAYAPPTASNKWNAVLASGAESNFIVPSNHQVWIALFAIEDGTIVWVDLTGATAAVPSGGSLTVCTSELITGNGLIVSRTVYAGNKISMITSSTTANVGVSLYPISYP